jgi:hypothetical protein
MRMTRFLLPVLLAVLVVTLPIGLARYVSAQGDQAGGSAPLQKAATGIWVNQGPSRGAVSTGNVDVEATIERDADDFLTLYGLSAPAPAA